MTIRDQIESAAAHCLTILRRYRNGERTAAAREMMAAEVGSVVGCLVELQLPPGVAEEEILAPVESYLIGLYGHEAGSRLNAEFVDAFEAAGMCLLSGRHGREDAAWHPRVEGWAHA